MSRQQERCAPHPSSLNFRQGNVSTSAPSRIIRYPVPPPCPAEEFAANHGWLLFHDKVKTTQVYLHDTTLVGKRLAWHNATISHSIQVSSVLLLFEDQQIGYDWLDSSHFFLQERICPFFSGLTLVRLLANFVVWR